MVQTDTGAGEVEELTLVGIADQAQRHPAGTVRRASTECLHRRLSLPGELSFAVPGHRRNGTGDAPIAGPAAARPGGPQPRGTGDAKHPSLMRQQRITW